MKKVAPVNILDLNFEQRVQQRHSTQTRAAEMEHAIRYHIRTHLDDDPVYYRKLSEKLEEILQNHQSNWDAIAAEFINLAQKVRSEQTDSEENQTNIKVKIRPFYNALIDVSKADKFIKTYYSGVSDENHVQEIVQELKNLVLDTDLKQLEIDYQQHCEIKDLMGDCDDSAWF